LRSGRSIRLRYGREKLAFALPASADILEIREPPHSVSRETFRQGLSELLPSSIPEGQVALVVADKTRLCDYPAMLPWLLELLHDRGVERQRIVFYIAYGTHAPQSDTESLTAYGPVFRDYTFIHHCSTEPDLFVELGLTRRGTPVRLRRDLLAAGLIITAGAVSHHYFAGFGGGRKLIFPGLAEQRAIYHNHQFFLDSERGTLAPGCRPGRMQGNPLAEDLEEIDRMLPPYLSIHGLLDSTGAVAAFRFGRTYEDFLAVCREHDALYRAHTSRQYDLVLASAGGFPKDINFIQAHKALDNAAAFVREGGRLLLLAECRDGIGSTTFLPYFAMGSREATFTSLVHHYSGNGGTALAMMAKTARIRVFMVTALDKELCQRIGIRAINAAQAEQLLADARSDLAVITNSSLLIR
jgi:nickel-dependent lactate racemase